MPELLWESERLSVYRDFCMVAFDEVSYLVDRAFDDGSATGLECTPGK